MKKLVVLVIFAIIFAGCTMNEVTENIEKAKDVLIKSHEVVTETIPVLKEIQQLDYIKEDVKEKIIMVIDGLILVNDKIGDIIEILGLSEEDPGEENVIEKTLKSENKTLNKAIEDLKNSKIG